jgi:hypothetical protein
MLEPEREPEPKPEPRALTLIVSVPIRGTGTRVVLCEETGELYQIYTPHHPAQLDGGHRVGRWYWYHCPEDRDGGDQCDTNQPGWNRWYAALCNLETSLAHSLAITEPDQGFVWKPADSGCQ